MSLNTDSGGVGPWLEMLCLAILLGVILKAVGSDFLKPTGQIR